MFSSKNGMRAHSPPNSTVDGFAPLSLVTVLKVACLFFTLHPVKVLRCARHMLSILSRAIHDGLRNSDNQKLNLSVYSCTPRHCPFNGVLAKMSRLDSRFGE